MEGINMDFCKFINSPDIREHLKKIGYEFSSEEAAYLVWQSKKATIAEKHAAWEEIIRAMPDCDISDYCLREPRKSLHDLLRFIIEKENEKLEKFLQADGSVYFDSYMPPEKRNFIDSPLELFASYEDCLGAIKTDDKFDEGTRHRIGKAEIGNRHHVTYLKLNEDFEGIAFEDRYGPDEKSDDLEDAIGCFWVIGFHLHIPLPFQKGDIVCEGKNEPFVFDENLENNIVWGYFQTPSGNIFSDDTYFPWNLEYYRGELTGTERILKALGSYLKGKIDIELYSMAYHTILLEEALEKSRPSGISDEGLKLAGLK